MSSNLQENTIKPGYTCALLSVSVVLLAPLLLGITIGSTGPSIDTMKNEVIDYDGNVMRLDQGSEFVVFTSSQASWFASLVTLGAMVGALLGGQMAKNMGYKKTLLVTVPLFVASFSVLAFGSNVYLLFVSRILVGVAVGINTFVAPLYINEVSPTHLRGMMGASNQLAVTIGILLAYAMGIVLKVDGGHVYAGLKELVPAPKNSFFNWRTLAVWSALPAVLLGIGVCFIPESPRWLASRGRLAEAKTELLRLLNGGTVAAEETALEDLAREFEEAKTKHTPISQWTLLWAANKQIGIAIALQFFQQFTGINAIMFYCTTIMRNAHVSHPEVVSIIVMSEQVIVTLISCFLMDLWGRRALLMTGASVMAFSCILFGLYFFLVSVVGATNITVLVYISVFIYMAAFSIGVGAIPWLIIGELLPDNVRATGSSIATTSNWLFAFVVTESLNSATKYLQYYGVMWVFGACAIGLIFFTAFCVPETLGKTLEEIQAYFNPSGYMPVKEKKEGSDLPARTRRCVTLRDELDRLLTIHETNAASALRV